MFPIVLLVLISCTEIVAAMNNRWETLENIRANSIFRVIPTSENELYATGFDETLGSRLYHSNDQGIHWESFPVIGNNLDFAISNDHRLLCGIGTKNYCLHLQDETKQVLELTMKATAYEIHAVEEQGFAMVGLFQPLTQDASVASLDNGVAYTPNIETDAWRSYDIGLKTSDGYLAIKGSFPSESTWYVVSGSWPVNNPLVSTSLTGKLSIVPGVELLSFNFDFQSLAATVGSVTGITSDTASSSGGNGGFVGAISKTSDGGKTWQKVFDSNKNFYFNEISCLNNDICVTVGEGLASTIVLMTVDGGKTWDQVLSVTSDYSLHGVKMVTKDDIWVTGGMKVFDNLQRKNVRMPKQKTNLRRRVLDQENTKFMGIYYHSTDGGKSWTLQTQEGYVYSISIEKTTKQIGYAATLHRDLSSISRCISSNYY